MVWNYGIRPVTELTSTGHRFIHNPHIGKAVGVGLLYKSQLRVRVHTHKTSFAASSFEHISFAGYCVSSTGQQHYHFPGGIFKSLGGNAYCLLKTGYPRGF